MNQAVRYRTSDFETFRENDTARLKWVVSTWLASLPTPRSRRDHERELTRFLDWCAEHRVRALAARTDDADVYVAATGRRHLAATTLERRRARLRSFYRAAVAAGAARSNPFDR